MSRGGWVRSSGQNFERNLLGPWLLHTDVSLTWTLMARTLLSTDKQPQAYQSLLNCRRRLLLFLILLAPSSLPKVAPSPSA
jgi:hypothetical protein